MREFWVAASLLWLAGVGLRLTILAVPPVIALIQSRSAALRDRDRHPFRVAGDPVRHCGAAGIAADCALRRLVDAGRGSADRGRGSGLRGAVLNVYVLYAATILMSAGIAIMQPALSPLVRQWLPQRVSFGTAIYSNGLLVARDPRRSC